MTPSRPLSLGKLYQLTINGPGSAGVTDPAGNLLVGNAATVPMSSYVLQISRGVVHPVPPSKPKPVASPTPHSAGPGDVSRVRLVATFTGHSIQAERKSGSGKVRVMGRSGGPRSLTPANPSMTGRSIARGTIGRR